MATVKKTIGKVPVWIEEYKSGSTYSKFNIVGMYGSSYISLIDNNTTPPATIGEDGNIIVDTEKWGIIADASKYYTFVDKKQDKLTAGNGIEINGENVISVTLDTDVFFVAEVLPESPTDEQKRKICLVPSTETESGNEYTEYVWVVNDEHPSGYWEEMGKFRAAIDLTPYQKKNDDGLQTQSKEVVGAINELNTNKQNATDNALQTTSKEITGAINEVKQTADSAQPKIDNALQTSDKTVVGGINELKVSLDGEGLNQICSLNTGSPSFKPLQNFDSMGINGTWMDTKNIIDTESPFKDTLGYMQVFTDKRPQFRSCFKFEDSYPKAPRSNRPNKIITSYWINEDDFPTPNQDYFSVSFASSQVKLYQPKDVRIKNLIEGEAIDTDTTNNVFSAHKKAYIASSVGKWHQVYVEYSNISWTLSEDETWMYGMTMTIFEATNSTYRLVNMIIMEDGNLLPGNHVVSDICGSVLGDFTYNIPDIKNRISNLNNEIGDIKDSISTQKLSTFTYSKVGDSSISSPFDSGVFKFSLNIHREVIDFSQNPNVNFSPAYLYPSDNTARVPLHTAVVDDITPANFNATYIGGNHGCDDSRKCTVTAHGKTYADIGSKWQNNGNQYTIIGIIDEDHIVLLGENTKVYPIFQMSVAPTGEYTHLSGATNTSSFTVSESVLVQLKPAITKSEKNIYIDGKEITEEGEYSFNELKICETYDILNVADILTYVQSKVGTFDANPDFSEFDVPKVARLTISYIFKSAYQMFIATSFSTLQDIEFSYFGFTQQGVLAGDNIKMYIPKALPITDTDGQKDFRLLRDYDIKSSGLYISNDLWENPLLPPDRWLEVSENCAINSGYLFDYGIAGEKRKDYTDKAFMLLNTLKTYPIGASKIHTMSSGDSISAVVWRTYMPLGAIDKNGILCANKFEFEGKLYMYLDFNAEGFYDISVPEKYAGKEVFVFESSSNAKLLTPISGNKLLVKVDSADPMYAYIVLQIKG